MSQISYRGNCKTPFGPKFALFPRRPFFRKLPTFNHVCQFAKNGLREKIIEFGSQSQFCNSLINICIDARWLNAPGIGTYLKNLLLHLSRYPARWYALVNPVHLPMLEGL